MREYLNKKTIMTEEKLLLIMQRLPMAEFGYSYKGGNDINLCPLCSKHEDSQKASFNDWETIKTEVKPDRRYSELFNNRIEKEFIQILKKIEEVRTQGKTC